jgi:signal transduction histidine kinase
LSLVATLVARIRKPVSSNKVSSFRDEVLRAQLNPLVPMAVCAGILAVFSILVQYASLRYDNKNAVDQLDLSDMHSVATSAPDIQWRVLALWIAQYGLSASPVATTHGDADIQMVTLVSGEQVPLSSVVSLLREGQLVDPLTLKTIGPAPIHWIDSLPAVGSNVILVNPSQSDQKDELPSNALNQGWKTVLLRLNNETTLALSSPPFRLSTKHITQLSLIAFAIFVGVTLIFFGGFLIFFRRFFAAKSAERLALPVELLAAEVRKAILHEAGITKVPIEAPLEIAQLAKDFNDLQGRYAVTLTQMEALLDAERSLVAQIAHELRNPLMVILGHAEAVLRSKDVDHHSTVITEQVADMHQLLSDLLDTARMESIESAIKMAEVDVSLIATEMARRFSAPGWRSGIVVRLANSSEMNLLAYADPRWLRQAIANLMTNAIRYTAEGGLVEITVRRDEDKVWIDVNDTGRDKINLDSMDLFIERNAGLGLKIVKRLMPAMGGGFEQHQDIQGGTETRIWLSVITKEVSR